jgi:hypothetical protein
MFIGVGTLVLIVITEATRWASRSMDRPFAILRLT